MFCVCASSASVKEDNTDNEQEKRDEKGTSERENNELEAVSIWKCLVYLFIVCLKIYKFIKRLLGMGQVNTVASQ